MDSFCRTLRPLTVRMHRIFQQETPENPLYRDVGNLLSLAFSCDSCGGVGLDIKAIDPEAICADCNGTGVKPEIESYWQYKEEEEE